MGYKVVNIALLSLDLAVRMRPPRTGGAYGERYAVYGR
jgi:hypothetical protein